MLTSGMSCHVTSYHIMSRHVMSCHVMSCHVMSCHAISCHGMLCYDMALINRTDCLYVKLAEFNVDVHSDVQDTVLLIAT